MRKNLMLALLSVALLLSGCGGKAPAVLKIDATVSQGVELDGDLALPTEVTVPSVWSLEKAIQLIASFEDDVSVYGYLSDGEPSVLIAWNGLAERFQWNYLTPHGFQFSTYYFDIDKDGEKEVVAMFLFGTGTGISVSELHVVEPDTSGAHLIDYSIPSELYKKAVDLLSTEFRADSVELSVDARELTIVRDDLSAFQSAVTSDSLVRYDVSEDQVSVSYGIGIAQAESTFLIENIAFLAAQLDFSDGVFSLSAFEISET